MNWKKTAFKNFRLYAITDLRAQDPLILKKVESAYRGGADIVQLRAKALPDTVVLTLALKLRRLADQYKRLFFVNDRLDIALAAGADGIHLGQDDLPVQTARKIIRKAGYSLWIGKSTHSLRQALTAEREGADYIGVGPIFGTPTKPSSRPVGISLIRRVKSRLGIPFVAIGGIDESNLQQVLRAGASRVALVRAVFSGKDVYESTKRLRKIIRPIAV